MSEPVILVRAATYDDARELTRLLGQLGYPADEGTIGVRLRALLGHEEHAVFVAESAPGELAGLAHVLEAPRLTADHQGVIAALVVDERHRGAGHGRALVERAATWARERGCRALAVRARVEREGAPAFYRALGFGERKTQRLFVRAL